MKVKAQVLIAIVKLEASIMSTLVAELPQVLHVVLSVTSTVDATPDIATLYLSRCLFPLKTRQMQKKTTDTYVT